MTSEPTTVCAAFQATAAANADAVALRTKGGEIEITWGEYAERVRQHRRRRSTGSACAAATRWR